jgi:hypothetical protein
MQREQTIHFDWTTKFGLALAGATLVGILVDSAPTLLSIGAMALRFLR